MSALHDRAQQLVDCLGQIGRVTVAFSGGVDSSVVAAAAARAGLQGLIAVTADSPSVPRWQLKLACRVAAEIGIPHRVVRTDEVGRLAYRRNDHDRCFHCKSTLYEALAACAQQAAASTTVSGTNADDLADYRPGIEAGRQAGVRMPLAELGFRKSEVRAIAAEFGLSNRDLPASPCLASRIAYGTEVTPERLAMVEQAEDWLRARKFGPLRVRLHADELARIEVAPSQLARLVEMNRGGELTEALRAIGFRYVTVDLDGFQSGSMNRSLVQIDAGSLRRPAVDAADIRNQGGQHRRGAIPNVLSPSSAPGSRP